MPSELFKNSCLNKADDLGRNSDLISSQLCLQKEFKFYLTKFLFALNAGWGFYTSKRAKVIPMSFSEVVIFVIL
jgi:hypothetical protein